MIASLILHALIGAQGLRPEVGNSVLRTDSGAHVIAGVPVKNYHHFLGRQSSMIASELPQKYVVVPEDGVTQSEVEASCESGDWDWTCAYIGHCADGVEFFEITCTVDFCDEDSLSVFLHDAQITISYMDADMLVDTIAEYQASEAPAWGLQKIGIAKRTTIGQGVRVYVMDSGIKFTHAEFGGRAKGVMDCTLRDSNDSPTICADSANPDCAIDELGQGTHVAGIVGGTNWGVAPGADLLALRVVDAAGAVMLSWVEEALDYVAHQAHLGHLPAVLYVGITNHAPANSIAEAIDKCVSEGVVVLTGAGAGPDGYPVDVSALPGVQPANQASVITVGSIGFWDNVTNVTIQDEVSWFSNFGPSVDIWAPGGNIYSADLYSDTAIWYFDGTGQACAHAVGVAALIQEMRPSSTPSDIREDMMAAGLTGVITGLYDNETDLLLQVVVQGLGSSRPDA